MSTAQNYPEVRHHLLFRTGINLFSSHWNPQKPRYFWHREPTLCKQKRPPFCECHISGNF